jgi:transcriptional regulator GlxA family with amidase domain
LIPSLYKKQVALIDQSLKEAKGLVTQEEAAQLIGRSKRHVRRIFRIVTGKSFRENCFAIEFSYAQELIQTTHLSIEAIADNLGYHNRGKFELKYKRIFGVTPAMDRSMKSVRAVSNDGVDNPVGHGA